MIAPFRSRSPRIAVTTHSSSNVSHSLRIAYPAQASCRARGFAAVVNYAQLGQQYQGDAGPSPYLRDIWQAADIRQSISYLVARHHYHDEAVQSNLGCPEDAVMPPSTGRMAPVTKRASSEARKSIGPAISSATA